jgi:hypothetical protein
MRRHAARRGACGGGRTGEGCQCVALRALAVGGEGACGGGRTTRRSTGVRVRGACDAVRLRRGGAGGGACGGGRAPCGCPPSSPPPSG